MPYYKRVCGPEAGGIPGRTTLEGWLARWALYLSEMKRFSDLPLYLQYLCKILFHVVDRTGKWFKYANINTLLHMNLDSVFWIDVDLNLFHDLST